MGKILSAVNGGKSMHMWSARLRIGSEAVQKHISRRTEMKQSRVLTLEIFPSTVRLRNLCIDSLITVCSSEGTREGNHGNNGTKNHSLQIVYFNGILI